MGCFSTCQGQLFDIFAGLPNPLNGSNITFAVSLLSCQSQTITHFMQQMVLSSSSMRHRQSSNGDSELFLSNSWITIGDPELKKTVCSPASVHILSWKTGVQNCLVTFVMF